MIPRIHNRILRYGLGLALALAAVVVTRGDIPEPDAVVYGQVYHRFDELLTATQSGQIVAIAQVNGVTLATNVVASGASAFLLRIPMDDGLEPRLPNTAKGGDEVHFYLRNNKTQVQYECLQSQILPGDRAPVISMNLAVKGNLLGAAPDSNGNGVPDYLESHFNFNPTNGTPPTARIVSPNAGLRWGSSVFTVTGIGYGGQLHEVWYQLNGGDWLLASTANGFMDWTSTVTLAAGTNVIRAIAVDAAGNCSAIDSSTLFYVVTKRLIVFVSGSGSLSPNYNSQFLEVGRGYSMTAIPGNGYVFSNWVGGVGSSLPVMGNAPTLNFVMRTNLTLRANFVLNPFPALKGTYNGLFAETGGVSHETSGFITFTLDDKGKFTGRILTGGGTYRVSGQFDVQRHAEITISRAGKTSLTVQLNVNPPAPGAHDVQGSVTDGSWTAPLLGDRAVFDARTNPAPQAGSYTLVVPGGADAAVSPGGDGIGGVTVSTDGLVSLTGTLADGTPIHQKVSLSKNGEWPLYSSLYAGKGSVLSWITFSNQPSSSFSGNLSWIKTSAAGGVYYPGGFSNVVTVIGSQYQASAGARLLNLTNGVAVLSGGNLSDPMAFNVTLSPDNLITVNLPGTSKLSLTLSGSTGKLSGSFLHPQTGLMTPIKGVLLQQQNTAQGFFLGTDQSGRLLLGE